MKLGKCHILYLNTISKSLCFGDTTKSVPIKSRFALTIPHPIDVKFVGLIYGC